MKPSLLKDTLAYQLEMRPATMFRNMENVPLPSVVQSLNLFMKLPKLGDWVDHDFCLPGTVNCTEPVMGNPETDGVIFYLMNHAVSIVRQRVSPLQPLGKYLPILEAYHAQIAARSARMFFYLLLICTRESRHEKTKNGTKYSGPEQVMAFHKKIPNDSDAAAQYLRSNPPDVRLGLYTQYLCDVFFNGSFASSSFGGPKWGEIAKVLHEFSTGKITAEMMMDTAFTLCHNGGPIFNKQMLFTHYSSDIYTMLDIQASGQIPILAATGGYSFINAYVKSLYKSLRDIIGPEFGAGHIDWYEVEDHGKKNYYSQKQAQVEQYGMPEKHKAKEAAKSAAKAKAQADAAIQAAIKDQDKVWITAEEFLTKMKGRAPA